MSHTFLESFWKPVSRAKRFLLLTAGMSGLYLALCAADILSSLPAQFPIADTVSMVLFSLFAGAAVELAVAGFSLGEFVKTRAFGTLINLLTGSLNGFVERVVTAAVTTYILSRIPYVASIAAIHLTSALTIGALVIGFVAFLIFQLPLYRVVLGYTQPDSTKRDKATWGLIALFALFAAVYPVFNSTLRALIGC